MIIQISHAYRNIKYSPSSQTTTPMALGEYVIETSPTAQVSVSTNFQICHECKNTTTEIQPPKQDMSASQAIQSPKTTPIDSTCIPMYSTE